MVIFSRIGLTTKTVSTKYVGLVPYLTFRQAVGVVVPVARHFPAARRRPGPNVSFLRGTGPDGSLTAKPA